ncbi:hypothetical protein SCUCBS95973_007356 [Sporothrix curviconia]|uniref:Protein kinase domain-containing protein n=1 Tax=Sporothrix curviconia TaxID=1260050 RepID=A0ABP0CDC2_9PEZI
MGAPGYSLNFVAIRRCDQKRWHVCVVVERRLLSLAVPNGTNCNAALNEFCRAIDFGTLDLLDDTRTQIFVHSKGHEHAHDPDGCRPFVHRPLPDGHAFNLDNLPVVAEMREDPARVRFPVLEAATPASRRVEWDRLQVVERLPALAAYTARLLPDMEQLYVLKSIERGLHIPQDTPALESELHVLEEVGGQDHIVWLVTAVVSDNPYSSTATGTAKSGPDYFRGLLLEYHPRGTLESVLKTDAEKQTEKPLPWASRWASQLCSAVAALHEHGFTHMDIKPSNMVIDKDESLILIDVGGAGGFTREWLSPYMSVVEENNAAEPLDMPLEDRKRNDMWAVGKIMLLMATGDEKQSQDIQAAARKLMADPPLTTLRQIAADL